MNYRGSYRHLLRNSKSAMLAAIEIYNKPRIDYRDECCVILIINAWELVLKAVLSKNGKSIYYPKKRRQPYRTLAWQDAFSAAERYFPKKLPVLPVRKNLELLGTYRDNAVHFYNEREFGRVFQALAQSSITNYVDLVKAVFEEDLGEEITWQLMPLGVRTPIDPVEYIAGGGTYGGGPQKSAMRQFLGELASAVQEIQHEGADTGRLLTILRVKLESVKKVQTADVTVGVGRAGEVEGPLAVVKAVDPNLSHPFRQTDILARVPEVHGRKFTSYIFQALAWKYDLKDDPRYCWRAKEGVLTRYSPDVVSWIGTLSAQDVEIAVRDYRLHNRERGRNVRKL